MCFIITIVLRIVVELTHYFSRSPPLSKGGGIMTIQFKKGVLELCVLSMLKQDDQYGYDVAIKLSQNIDVADGSIYLVLRRLKQEDYVTSYLEESSGGPPRKYYVITRKGERFLDELIAEWGMLVNNVNSIIAGGSAVTNKVNKIIASESVNDTDSEPLAPVAVGMEINDIDGGIENE